MFGRLELTDLSGVAEATARRLHRAGVHTPLQFLEATAEQLAAAGMRAPVADAWRRRLRGFEVDTFQGASRKSYSHSHVLARATRSRADLEELLMWLSEMVGRRLRAAGRRGRVISVGVVYRPDTGRLSRQTTLPRPVVTGDEIYRAASQLLAARDAARDVGTLGVAVGGLTEPTSDATDPGSGQAELFGEGIRPRSERPRNERLELAMDAIRDRFGEDAVQRARLLGRARVVRDRIAFGNTGHPDERHPDEREPG